MAFSHLTEFIEQTGVFDNKKLYYINNASKEDITVKWGAKDPDARGAGTYTIRSGERGGPYPQFLAFHIVKSLVSREMLRDGKDKFFGSAEFRAPYEDKFLIEVEGESTEDPIIAEIRSQEREKLRKELADKPLADGATTTSETRRRALKRSSPTEEPKEFAGANT